MKIEFFVPFWTRGPKSVILRPDFILCKTGEIARMAELVDASDSKSGYRKVVQVRFLFRAPKSQNPLS
jgi:hypothetical protein